MLAIHPGALGDVLLAIPALRALRQRHPGARLTLGAQARIGGLLAALGVVDAAVPFDALGLDALFTDDAPPARTRALAEWSRIVCWFGARDPSFVRRLRALVPAAVVAPAVAGTATVWKHLLETVDAPPGPWREPVSVPAALAEPGRAALAGAGWDGRWPPVMVHPGAGGRAKCWPAEGFAEVVERLRRAGRAVVLHQGPAAPDAEAVAGVGLALDRALPVLAEPDLISLAATLAHVGGYVGNDSGVSHLAAALGVRALVLLTPEMARWAPWSATARPLTVHADRLDSGDVAAVMRGVDAIIA